MTTFKLFLLAAMLMLATLSTVSARAQPQVLPVFGGNGGGNFNLECPGKFEGVAIRRGAWITGLGLICNGRHLAMTGGGHDPSEEYVCPAGGTVNAVKYGFTRDGSQPKYLDYLELHCSHGDIHCFHTGDGCWDRHPNRGNTSGYGLTNVSACSAGQHGYGLAGRSGAAIDALAMECAPATPLTNDNTRYACCEHVVTGSDGKVHRVRYCDDDCPRT